MSFLFFFSFGVFLSRLRLAVLLRLSVRFSGGEVEIVGVFVGRDCVCLRSVVIGCLTVGFLFVCFVLFIIWGVVVQSVGRG